MAKFLQEILAGATALLGVDSVHAERALKGLDGPGVFFHQGKTVPPLYDAEEPDRRRDRDKARDAAIRFLLVLRRDGEGTCGFQ